MNHRTNDNIGRRDFLRIGLSAVALSVLAACGSAATPSATTAPTPTTAQAAAVAPTATTLTSAASEPTVTTAAAATSGNTTASGAQGGVYQIDASKSKAIFTLGEKLMGKDNTVVGTSTKVNGTITTSLDHPADAKMSVIQIDASDVKTDSGMRDRMIQRLILQSQQAEFQFITFEPTAIVGLPSQAVKTGDTLPLKITGNLKIRNVIQPITFDTTVTVKSDTELDGVAKTTVTRNAFQLEIPNVPSVAGVTDNVGLEFQFVAMKQ